MFVKSTASILDPMTEYKLTWDPENEKSVVKTVVFLHNLNKKLQSGEVKKIKAL